MTSPRTSCPTSSDVPERSRASSRASTCRRSASGGLGVANAAAAEPSSPPLRAGRSAPRPRANSKRSRRTRSCEARTAASSGPIDPAQFGAEGTGGSPSAEALALLHNKRVTLDPTGAADIKAGKMDPRIVSVLTSDREAITASPSRPRSPTTTGSRPAARSRITSTGALSTSRASTASPSARATRPRGEVATALSHLDPSIRPSEIGSPWALPGAAYFTDGAHQNHLHIAFDDPIAPSWKAPEDAGADRRPRHPRGVRTRGAAVRRRRRQRRRRQRRRRRRRRRRARRARGPRRRHGRRGRCRRATATVATTGTTPSRTTPATSRRTTRTAATTGIATMSARQQRHGSDSGDGGDSGDDSDGDSSSGGDAGGQIDLGDVDGELSGRRRVPGGDRRVDGQ